MIPAIEERKEKLQREIEALTQEYQVDLPKQIAEARALGDLKENSEFHAARERQAHVKVRIDQLGRQISQLNQIASSQDDSPTIGFGSQVVVLERNSQKRSEFTLAQPSDDDLAEGEISIGSPVGKALRGHTVGEEVIVRVPAGEKRFYIEKITTLLGKVYEATGD
ncbi:MAG TPA: GreA/GreB family elongation factor [Candidatus Aminicenantes bacterium]|nr:GreA/GreB family elongation factor [Candidatus Aminicenantes bacterium]